MRLVIAILFACGIVQAQDCADCDACVAKACNTNCDDLASARNDLKAARTEYKRLARVEKDALADAHQHVFKQTKRGQALAPTFVAAADQLELAAQEAKANEKLAKLCADMAASYRALARTLDKKESCLTPEQRAQKPSERAGTTLKLAKTRIESAAAEEATEETNTCWSIIKEGDPRYASLARNMAALDAAQQTVQRKAGEKKLATSLNNAKDLHVSLMPYFTDVKTERPAPAEALPAP